MREVNEAITTSNAAIERYAQEGAKRFEDAAAERRIELAVATLERIKAAEQVEKDLAWIRKLILKAIRKHQMDVCLYRWRTIPCNAKYYADALQRRLDTAGEGVFRVKVVLANGGWRWHPWPEAAVQVSW